MSLKRSEVLAFRAALVVAVILITFLTTARIPSEVGGAVNDKLSHALAFFALALLTDFSFADSRLGLKKVSALFAYGTIIELIQHQLPYREFSLADLVANGMGIFAYWLSIPLLRRLPRLKARWTQLRPDGKFFQ